MLSRSKTASSPTYPTFLLPSLKIPFFRRRRSSATTASARSNDLPSLSSSPASAASTDPFSSSPTTITLSPVHDLKTPIIYEIAADELTSRPTFTVPASAVPTNPHRLTSPGLPDVLRCGTCGTDLAYGLQIVSKGFTGRHGRALLVGAPVAASTPSCPGASFSNSLNTLPSSRKHNDVAPGHHALAHESANLVNVKVGTPEPRSLVTGAHVVADIRCAVCSVVVGWKYVDAREQAQKYKVGKFILETERTVLVRSWEDGVEDAALEGRRHFYSSSAPVGSFSGRARRSASLLLGGRRKESTSSDGPAGVGAFVVEEVDEESSSAAESEGEISFDSDDEDECEDIFLGVWDAATVAKRRESRHGPSGSQRKGKKARASRDC